MSLFSALDFMWDDKDMVRIEDDQDRGSAEKDAVSVED